MKKLIILPLLFLTACATKTPATTALVNSTQTAIDNLQGQVAALPKECDTGLISASLSTIKANVAAISETCKADVKSATAKSDNRYYKALILAFLGWVLVIFGLYKYFKKLGWL